MARQEEAHCCIHAAFSAAPAAAVSVPAPPRFAPAPAGRRKLWELEDKHHCPVIGTCLSMDELMRFARRFGFSGNMHDEYELHAEAVGLAGQRNPVSELMQKHLDRKYDRQRRQFDKAKTDEEVHRLWRAALARGEVVGAMWAALTHKAATADTRHAIYADVHMLSHQVGAGQAADARRLATLEKEHAELKRRLDGSQCERKAVEAALRDELRRAEAEAERLRVQATEGEALRRRVAELESGSGLQELSQRLQQLQLSREQAQAAIGRAAELEQRLSVLEDDLAAAQAERDRLAAEHGVLERLLAAAAAPAETTVPDAACCSGCTQAPERCVLCVGGRTALVAQYRSLAGRLGMRLLHHDGGKEEALSRLPELINAADAVICPTDCVSHSAYYKLKSQCKRSGKPCLLFKGAGLSSFAVALERLARGEAHVGRET